MMMTECVTISDMSLYGPYTLNLKPYSFQRGLSWLSGREKIVFRAVYQTMMMTGCVTISDMSLYGPYTLNLNLKPYSFQSCVSNIESKSEPAPPLLCHRKHAESLCMADAETQRQRTSHSKQPFALPSSGLLWCLYPRFVEDGRHVYVTRQCYFAYFDVLLVRKPDSFQCWAC